MIRIAALIDPNDPLGRSYCEINTEKAHNIPLGTLVEIESGVRLFVVMRWRDCDQTPLYSLSPKQDDTKQKHPHFGNDLWLNGYTEESLRVV